MQAEIVFWLAEDGAARSAARARPVADWRTVPLRPGALFVVGDPKQSIYRFRRADIDIYNIVRAAFQRSGGRLCRAAHTELSLGAAVVRVGEPGLSDAISRPNRRRTRLASRRSIRAIDTRRSGGVFTLTHDCDRDELQEHDAAKIATYIRSEVDAGRRRFSDFLILTRKKRNRLAPYARALESLNIPIEVSGAGAFGESAEVEALDDAAAGAGRSPGCAVARRRPARSAVRHQRPGAVCVQAGRRLVQHLPARRQQRVPASAAATASASRWPPSISSTAGRACFRRPPRSTAFSKHTGYLAFAATTPGGVDAGDLLHAVDRVRQVVEEGGSLADAADSLEADSEAANEVESLPLEPGRTDVVRVMNLHKAKGLEATVVFLADPNGGLALRVDNHIERKDLKAQGWFKLVQKSEGNPGAASCSASMPTGLTRSGGTAVSRGRRGPAAVCGGDPCARAARGQPLDRQPHAQRLGRSQ